MNTLSRLPVSLPRLARGPVLLLAACLPLLTNGQTAAGPASSPAASAAEVFRRLAADRWVYREVTFAAGTGQCPAERR